MLSTDIAIIGAGPVGLAFASSLSDAGIRSILLERAPEAALASPSPDGREIALTHRAMAILEELGAWELLPEGAASPIRGARVYNGTSPFALRFDPDAADDDAPLGKFVANSAIRRALYGAAMQRDGLKLLTGRTATTIVRERGGVVVHATGGEPVHARLAVAADTRFSPMRAQQGISVLRDDYGTAMLVCRMTHQRPHDHIAREMFNYGGVIAVLTLNGNRCSIVVSRGHDEIRQLAAADEAEFEAEITRGVRGMLGAMKLDGKRHVYPIIGTFARRFVGRRFALIGDAAVGMHPVTALGFNIGIRSQDTLAHEIAQAVACGRDVADPAALRRYEIVHRRLAFPLWTGTNVVAHLYRREGPVSRIARGAALRIAERLPPFKRATNALLMGRMRAA